MQEFKYNPYDSPDKFGLEIVRVYDEPDLSYEFNMVVVWRDKKTGKEYWAADSGCSCPSPFENVSSMADLHELALTREAFERAIDGMV